MQLQCAKLVFFWKQWKPASKAYWVHGSTVRSFINCAFSFYSILIYIVAMVFSVVPHRKARTKRTYYYGASFKLWRIKAKESSDNSQTNNQRIDISFFIIMYHYHVSLSCVLIVIIIIFHISYIIYYYHYHDSVCMQPSCKSFNVYNFISIMLVQHDVACTYSYQWMQLSFFWSNAHVRY